MQNSDLAKQFSFNPNQNKHQSLEAKENMQNIANYLTQTNE